jgi:hypothetical protein
MKACPYRNTFYEKLANDPAGGPAVPMDTVHSEMDRWLAGLAAINLRMNEFYKAGGHDKGF